MIERSDLERVWLETAHIFRGEDGPINDWLEENEFEPDGLLSFLDDTLKQLVFAAYRLDQEKDENRPENVMLAVGASLFFMGWEMNRQLGKPSSHVAE